jgi:hypothetical protein
MSCSRSAWSTSQLNKSGLIHRALVVPSQPCAGRREEASYQRRRRECWSARPHAGPCSFAALQASCVGLRHHDSTLGNVVW